MNGGSMAVIWKWKPSHHRGPSHTNGSWLVLRSEGDMAKSKQDHDRVNCVFWLGMCCPSQVCPSKPNNKEYYLNVLCWLRDITKSHSYGQQVIGRFIMTMCPLMHHISCRVFWQNIKSPGDSAPLQPRFDALRLLSFPKGKGHQCSSHLGHMPVFPKGKWFQTIDEIQENTMEQLMAILTKDFAVFWTVEETLGGMLRSQGAYFKGDWGVIGLCTMFLVSSSVKNCIFHNTWLDTFQTDLIEEV